VKIVCFSEIQWRYVRTRKQQILTRFPPGWEILFLSSVVRGRPNNFLPEREGRITHVCIPVLKNFPQKSLRALFSFPPVRFLWNVMLWMWLHVIFIVTGFARGDRIFYVSNIYYAGVLGAVRRKLLLYDCNDDPLGFPGTPGWAARYFRGLVRSADLITAVSSGLVRRLREAGAGEVHLIGNGVDFDLFSRAASRGIPDDMSEMIRPIIGYVGAIAHWFDFELLDRLAGEYPSATLALVGPLYQDLRARMEEVTSRRPNVHLLGTKPYEELGRYVSAMDICLIPLQVNELRRAADPNKLYEYAACGRPIVTMAYSDEIRSLSDLVYTADNRDEFVSRVGEALEKGADGERLTAFARSRSWQARADEMHYLIAKHAGIPPGKEAT
jgi:glycosyltransferase involved in cell wall biosynthesis